MSKSFNRLLAVLLALGAPATTAMAQQSDGYSFLKAVRERDGAKVQSLLSEAGSIAINARESGSGDGALHILARARDYGWFSYILGRPNVRRDLQNKDGDTALTIAARIGWLEGAELLVQRRAGIDLPNSRGETPLIIAVQRRDLNLARLLLNAGANPNKADSVAGYSALDYAKRDPRATAVLKLLETPVAPARPAAGPPVR
jgi:ankyrin repeat protein